MSVDRLLEVDDDVEAFDDFLRQRGWSDGLPCIPPTSQRVEAMLERADVAGGAIVGQVPVSNRVMDMATLAANAVMAGCRPEYFPVVLAAARALLDWDFNLAGVTATTHPAGPLLIISGSICEELRLQYGSGALAPGNRGNATIGRTIRLMLLTVGSATPGSGDKATHGHPGKYSYVLAENSAATPWATLASRLGYAPNVSTVTVVAAEAPRNVNDHASTTAPEIVRSLAGTIASLGHNNLHRGGPIVMLLGPEHAAVIHRDGMSEQELRERVFEKAQVPVSVIPEGNLGRMARIRPERFGDPAPDATVPVTTGPEDFLTVVAGGEGRHSMMIPSFGVSAAVTRSID